MDLDYKGLANCGTWFIGRLQTERDKLRVVEGLKSAQAVGDDTNLEALMSNLTQRVFLMRNVHEDAPVLMKTRWALSFLRGPLTGPEIARVMNPRKAAAAAVAGATVSATPAVTCAGQFINRKQRWRTPGRRRGYRRVFPRGIEGVGRRALQTHDRRLRQAALRGREAEARRVANRRMAGASRRRRRQCVLGGRVPDAQLKARLMNTPADAATYADIPGAALRAASYAGWAKSLQSQLYETARAQVFWCEALKSALETR